MTNLKPARVRFAPSPTGRLHIGSGRTALYNYLLARQTGGQFILRLEDTDQKRFVEGSEQAMIDGLKWLALEWDEGFDIGGPHAPYRQSERKAIYQEYANQLIESGHAFHCFCTPQRLNEVRQAQQKNKQPTRYDGTCHNLSKDEVQTRIDSGEKFVIRYRMPTEGSITAHDELRGDITIQNAQLDDYVLVKSDGLALYHLAAIVDDHLMEITHVFRSEEWLATFPLHVHIYNALGWEQPKWCHLSVFLKPSGKGKMSKRESAEMAKGGMSIFVTDLEELGYIPEAVVNWLVLMGWSFDGETEFFSMDDLIEKFSIEKLNPSPAAMNFSKFDHFNGLHIRNLAVEDLAERIKPYFAAAGIATNDDLLLKIAPLLQERLKTIDDAVTFAEFFFKEEVNPTIEELLPRKTTEADALTSAQRSLEILEGLDTINHDSAEPPLRALAEELEMSAGQVFGILRGAVTGQKVSPPLFESMEIVGREKVITRVKNAISILEAAI
jgi:glutamyl-tRNA synthetase